MNGRTRKSLGIVKTPKIKIAMVTRKKKASRSSTRGEEGGEGNALSHVLDLTASLSKRLVSSVLKGVVPVAIFPVNPGGFGPIERGHRGWCSCCLVSAVQRGPVCGHPATARLSHLSLLRTSNCEV